ncbi:MAG: TolC family protein [Dethiobacteria bacterium]|jgi:hypothetical protein
MKKILIYPFLLGILISIAIPVSAATASSNGIPLGLDIANAFTDELTVKSGLNYDQAVEMALKNSTELKNAREGKLQAEEMREMLANLRRITGSTAIPIGPGYDQADAADRDLLLKFTAADNAWRMAAKQAEALEETIAFQVRSAYDDVLQNTANLEKTERALDFTAKKLIQIDTKTRLGMESNFNRENARSGYAAEKEQREHLARQLDEAYTNLNKLLGLEPGARPKLQEHDPSAWLGEGQGLVTGLDEASLERHLALVLHDHPYIWLQEQQVAQAERELSLYTYNVGLPPYKVVASTVQQEKNNLYALKEEVHKGVRSLYYQLQGLENQYKALEKNLSQAENGLRVAQLRLKLGMAVPLEVEQAELALQEIKCGLQDLARAYGQLKMLYEKPWLLPVLPKNND